MIDDWPGVFLWIQESLWSAISTKFCHEDKSLYDRRSVPGFTLDDKDPDVRRSVPGFTHDDKDPDVRRSVPAPQRRGRMTRAPVGILPERRKTLIFDYAIGAFRFVLGS